MLAGIFLAGFANIYTYAAEEDQITTSNTETIDKTADAQTTLADTNITTVADSTTTSTEQSNVTDADAATVKDDKATVSTTTKEQTTKKTTKATVKTTKKTTTKKTTAKATVKASVNYSKAELRLLSALIYCEAGGEAYNGKLAVGIVVMNRVRSAAFPDSVKSVIYQRYQFGPVTNGALNKALSEYDSGKFTSQNEKACVKAAKEALSGQKSITVGGKTKKFGSYLFFSGRLHGYTYRLGHHQFK
jgi:spore germination cell wall hydrolase CwlJ-like protein